MTAVTVPGRDVRLPAKARQAVALHQPVEVRHHNRPAFYVLHADDYVLVAHLLERHHQGLPIPVAELLSDDDFAVLTEERELDAGLDAGILMGLEH